MKHRSMLLLRVSMGVLMLFWGIDKLVNVEHSVRVAESFYLGIGSQVLVLRVFGVLQIALGVLVVLGLLRVFAYPVLIAISGITMLGVWKSIVDPWGWFLEGSNVLFYPSLIIFAASLVLWSFVEQDPLSLDARRGGG